MIVPPASDQPDPTPTAAPETPTTPPTPPTERIATWPAWVKSLDAAMLVLVLITAFLAASNVARNTDQWLYYASGRALLNGEYSLGSDPFSFATAGRTWVNHSWLSSVAAYLLYNADSTGFVIVAVKAFLFALTFGLVFLLRRAGQPIWPWVLATAVAVIAAAPHSGVRPLFLSALFLAVTLVLLFVRDWKSGTHRVNLILLGVSSWLWASSDTWFLLGPLTIGLVLAGEWLQRFLAGPEEKAQLLAEGIPLRALVLALAVSVVASSLTPHHVRVWQFPVEVGFSVPPNAQSDPEIVVQTLSPTDKKNYIDIPSRGGSVNGVAFAVLLIGGGLVLAAAGSFARLRITHVLLWIAFAGLALLQYRLILFFTVAAVPLVALSLTDLIGKVRLGPADRPRTNLLLLMSSVGRLLAFPVALILVAVAYPGWLHPTPNHPSLSARVAWGVEPDPGLKRTAELLNQWRESGKLPADYRGLILNFDLANHVAWFAPKEKVFANGRYVFHAQEMESLVKVRRSILRRARVPADLIIDPVEISNLREACRQHDITYLVYTGIDSILAPVNPYPMYQLTTTEVPFALWHVDGRAVVLGDTAAKGFRPEAFRPLAFDPVRLAFRPELVAPLPPPPEVIHKDTTETFLDAFRQDPPKPPPVEAHDALTWYDIGDRLERDEHRFRMANWPLLAGAVGNPVPASEVQNLSYRPSDLAVSYNLLAFRAAWRAIAANPDYPDSYSVLALAAGPGRNSIPGLRAEVKQQLQIAGLRQSLDRFTAGETLDPTTVYQASQLAFQLSLLYQPDAATRNGQLVLPDASRQMLLLARKYYENSKQARDNPQEYVVRMKDFDARSKRLEDMIIPANNNFQNYKNEEPAVQVRRAAERGLLVTATEKFAEVWVSKNFGAQPQQLVLMAVRLYIVLGKVDEADFYLSKLEEEFEEARAKGAVPENMLAETQFLRTQLWQLRGDYGKIGDLLEKTARLPALTPAEKEAVQTAVSKKTAEEFDRYIQTPALMGAVGGAGRFTENRAEMGVSKWLNTSEFFVQRAMFLIFEGKIPEAKIRLEQSLRPDKIEFPAYHPQRMLSEQYLRMIDRATK